MSLALKATQGAIWSILGSLLSRSAGLVGTLILTYFLAPEVVGEVAVAYIVVFSVNQLSIIGFGQYVIAKPELGRGAVFHASVLNLGFAAVALTSLLVAADALAPLFGAEKMTHFVPGLVCAAALQRLGFIPERILARDLRFGRLSIGRCIGELSYVAAAVSFAALGHGGDAIVYGNIARTGVAAAIFLVSVTPGAWLTPTRLSKEQIRHIFRFGTPISVGAALGFASRRWDNLLVSALFGPGVMGLYKMAYNLADVPATHIGEHVGDVLLPSFSRMHGSRARAALVRSTTLLALVVFPLAVGLGAVAPTLVDTLLRDEWAGVAPFLAILSFLSVVRPIGWTIASYLQARDMPVPVMMLSIFKVVLLLGLIVLLGQIGPLMAAVAVGIAFAAHAWASLWVVKRADDLPMRDVAVPLIGPTAACILMVAGIQLTRLALQPLEPAGWLLLIAEIATGALVYVLASLVLARSASRDLLGLLRRVVSRGRGAAGDQHDPDPESSREQPATASA